MLDIVNGILLKIFSFIIFKVDCFIGEEMIQSNKILWMPSELNFDVLH